MIKFAGHEPGTITFFEASDLIDQLLNQQGLEERWVRYTIATDDFGRDSDELKPFTEGELEAIDIPDDWDSSDRVTAENLKLIKRLVADEGVFDDPCPRVEVSDREFVFTGRFSFGTRKTCIEAASRKGARCTTGDEVTMLTDYLVVGEKGNANYAHGSWGTKIAAAVLFRFQYGHPAIVRESDWIAAMEAA
ncbi:MAG: hypothetical protein ACE37K_11115 [Planctomycetota bacterium]